ncbi:MAG: PH domain-containing protein [Anaerolineae bacterium]
MEEWITDKRIGTQTGILLILLLIVLDFVAVGVIGSQPIGPVTFFMGLFMLISLPLIGVIIYQLAGLARSGYALDRNSLTIVWGPIRQMVPTEAIQRIMLGTEVQGGARRFRGWRWPGLMQGQAEVNEAGLTLFYASSALKNQLIVVTPTISYAISPTDAAGFIESIKARYELGPTQAIEQTTHHPPLFDWPLWRDRLAWGFSGLTLVALIGLFALICFRYPDLPARLPMHYSVAGLVDRVGVRSDVFILPVIGVMTLLVNVVIGVMVYQRERMASYVLWGGMLLVQFLLWVGAFNLLKT